MGFSVPRTFSNRKLSSSRTFYNPQLSLPQKKVLRTRFTYPRLEYTGCHQGLILRWRDRDVTI